MNLGGIQNGLQTNTEFHASFSASSNTNAFSGASFNEDQLQQAINHLSQALTSIENGNSGAANNCNKGGENSEAVKGLLEKFINLLQSFVNGGGSENQQNPQLPTNNGGQNNSPITINNFNEAPKEEGNFLEKLLTAPLEFAKSLTGGLLGGGKEGGGGLGGILGGLFGGGGKEGGGGLGGILGIVGSFFGPVGGVVGGLLGGILGGKK